MAGLATCVTPWAELISRSKLRLDLSLRRQTPTYLTDLLVIPPVLLQLGCRGCQREFTMQIAYVNTLVSDLDRVVKFYVGTFGLELEHAALEHRYASLAVGPVGPVRLGLAVAGPDQKDLIGRHTDVGFSVLISTRQSMLVCRSPCYFYYGTHTPALGWLHGTCRRPRGKRILSGPGLGHTQIKERPVGVRRGNPRALIHAKSGRLNRVNVHSRFL